MSLYRKRSKGKIEAEIEYISEEIKKKQTELCNLRNKRNFLESELDFNLPEGKEGKFSVFTTL